MDESHWIATHVELTFLPSIGQRRCSSQPVSRKRSSWEGEGILDDEQQGVRFVLAIHHRIVSASTLSIISINFF
jgi:hypothetical protein